LNYNLPMPEAKFGTILVDPPWPHDVDQNARRQLQYDRMSIDEIKGIPIPTISHADSHLWLWVTNTHMPFVFDVLAAWNFTYRVMATWDKQRIGNGWWLRSRTEHLVFAARTTSLRHNPGAFSTLLSAPAGKHSEKPEVAYQMIEALSPGPRIELFARQERNGWTTMLGERQISGDPYKPQLPITTPPAQVKGVGGWVPEIGKNVVYLDRTVTHVPVEIVGVRGRKIQVVMNGEKKIVSIDRLREATA
jgi:N6-adenosine-specific RNA methylase IME4